MPTAYQNPGPTREEIDATAGPLLLEFGTEWCGHCQAAAPEVAQALAAHPAVPHVRVEDGPGRPLGRSFRVTLWPTIIALKDGVEQGRVVRPESADLVRGVLEKIV